MDYFESMRFSSLERSLLDPPEPDDFDYDEWFDEMADLEFERAREERILKEVTPNV